MGFCLRFSSPRIWNQNIQKGVDRMKLSRESQYGLEGLGYLAEQPDGAILQIVEISEGASLPKAFLAKIFRKLSLYGIVISHRGKERGFQLARPADAINVREVVEAIEGPDLFSRCIFWSAVCSNDNPCNLHEVWAKIRPLLTEELENVSVADWAKQATK